MKLLLGIMLILCSFSILAAIPVDIDDVARFGEVEINQNWKTVFHGGSFTEPVVVAKPLSFNGGQPAHTRIRNITADSFEIRAEEWQYQDGDHWTENVSYIVMEVGTYLIDGRQIEAGKRLLYKRMYTKFNEPFPTVPVVLASVQTESYTRPIDVRIDVVENWRFFSRPQQEQAIHKLREKIGIERMGYIAAEEGKYALKVLEVGRKENVTHEWTQLKLPYMNPLFLAAVQSKGGDDTISVRYKHNPGNPFFVKLQEEQSWDEEVKHGRETLGYFVYN